MEPTTTQLADAIAALDERFSAHAAAEEAALHRLMNAFPEGDVDGHRRAHEAMIEAAREQAEFWRDLKQDVAKRSLWGLIRLIGWLVAVGGVAYVAGKLGIVVKP